MGAVGHSASTCSTNVQVLGAAYLKVTIILGHTCTCSSRLLFT